MEVFATTFARNRTPPARESVSNMISLRATLRTSVFLFVLLATLTRAAVPVDLTGLAPASEIRVLHDPVTNLVTLDWPTSESATGPRASLTVTLAKDKPLLSRVAWQTTPSAASITIAENLTPLTILTVGHRDLTRNGWMVFFDKVNTRPSQRYPVRLAPTSAKLT